MNSPEKYPSTPHWPWSEKIHRDDSYHPEPEFFVGKDVVVTEKLDGGNTCLYQGEVFARSVTQPSHAGWFSMVRKHHAWKTTNIDLMLYGEDIYGVHSINYYSVAEENTFWLFSVRDNMGFLSWNEVQKLASRMGMKTVPPFFRGTFHSVEEITKFFEANIRGPSVIGPDIEGFVMRLPEGYFPFEHFSRTCKYVRANHIQTDEHWTRNWKPCGIKR